MCINDVIYSLVLGDGFVSKQDQLSLYHCEKQLDFLNWKISLFQPYYNRDLKPTRCERLLNNKVFIEYRWYLALKKKFNLKGIRKEIYGDSSKKDYFKILNKVDDKNFLLTVWLGDDGSCSTKYQLCLCTLDRTEAENEKLCEWFSEHFNVKPYVVKQTSKKQNTEWYFIRFTKNDSMKIWSIARETLLKIPSMQYKFRHIENTYNKNRI